MSLNKKTFTTLSSLLLLLPSLAYSQEQPAAEELVGRAYIGIHGMKINTDDDRMLPQGGVDYIKHGSGVGGEVGYRFTEFSELRFSYTDLNLTKSGGLVTTPSGSNVALNYLYFPNKANFYLMAGASELEVVDSNLSANLGAGYRHYVSERSAIYLEANGHYQFDDNHKDMSAQIGFIYFFGDSAKKSVQSKPVIAQQMATKATAPVVAPVVVQATDSDKDGVVDSQDQCNNTPSGDQVDSYGCTIFTDENDELNLQVKFDNAKAVVKDEYLDEIKVAADFLRQYPNISLSINGHTSSQGSAAYNKLLSQKRAQAIVDVLINQFDVDASRLTAHGFGEEQLLTQGTTAADHAENRRIEAKVVVAKKVAVKK